MNRPALGSRSVSRRNVESAVCLLIVAAAFGGATLTQLDLGTLRRMGPGFFPFVLSAGMVLLSILTLLQRNDAEAEGDTTSLSARSFIPICAGIGAFGLLVDHAGLAPATTVAVVLTATASKRFSLLRIVGLGLAAAVFCSAVFVYGLSLPIPLFKGLF